MARGRCGSTSAPRPASGKTVAMLAEGRRRLERGTDVVIGFVETHGRPYTAGQVDGLEVVPRRAVEHRGASLDRAGRRRGPRPATRGRARRRARAHQRARLAATPKRWQDIDELLDAGIDVISTVNIQHLESLNDVVEAITGVVQQRDRARRGRALAPTRSSWSTCRRRRCAGGWRTATSTPPTASTPPWPTTSAPGNLSALRELALLWLADRVDETPGAVPRRRRASSAPWPTRERIVVALTGGPEGETVLRRAAQIASRAAGGELLACHVSRPDGLVDADPETLAAQRKLVKELGGVMHEVAGSDVAESILDVARGVNATPDRHRHQPPLAAGPAHSTRRRRAGRRGIRRHRRAPGQPHRRPRRGSAARRRRPRSSTRRWGGWLLATVGVAAGHPRPARHPRTARAAARGAAVPLAHRRDRASSAACCRPSPVPWSRRWSSTGSSPTRRAR